jgi:dipeptidyl aminopeptidase/acylaminoacyl peptidase
MIKRVLALLAAVFVAAAARADARPVAAEDLFKLSYLSSATISHDGREVAYVVTKMNGPKDRYDSNIWIADVASGKTWQLTRGDSDDSPAWSPDDKWIAFDSGRDEKGQIYRIALSGGEAERLTNLPGGASAPVWSHDGAHILFQSVTVDQLPPAHIDFSKAGFSPSADQRTSDVRVITALHIVANGAGIIYDKHSHLWVMAADGTGARALTSGHQWSEGNAVWSPDDKTIAFNAYHGTDPYGLRDDIYLMPSSGGAARAIPLDPVGNDGPAWAPDGSGLYYYQSVDHDQAAYPAVAFTSLTGTVQRVLIPKDTVAWGDAVITDTTEGGGGCGLLFEPGGRWFVADVSTPGASELERYDVQTGTATLITGGDREIRDCSMSDDGSQIAFTASDALHPAEVFVVPTAGGTPRQLSNANASLLAALDLSQPQPFSVNDHAGFTVAAWIMRPPHEVAGRKYPTILDIHGGPQTEFGNSFFHEFQYLTALGYIVVYANPRGSVGYGYPFEAALNHSWGDAMFDDEMAVMDAASRQPDVDTSRLGISGGSYGGYASIWVIAHTHRFKAAISERPASDLITQWLTGDINIAWDPKYSWGNPWDHFADNWKQSPAAYVANITTPLMLLHSDEDVRTPVGQTLQVYSSLKILGRTVQYVEFPRENHDLSRTGEPIHRVERLRISADWFAQYLKP